MLVPDFGARLDALGARSHVWIVEIPANRIAAERVWKRMRAEHAPERGVTLFEADLRVPGSEIAGEELDTIELHHGASWSRLEVYGAQLTSELRRALAQLGFVTIETTGEGFEASRAAPTEPVQPGG